MKCAPFVVIGISACLSLASLGSADDGPPVRRESEMDARLPIVGVSVPPAGLHADNGLPVPANLFQGHYSVVIFGCLT